MKKKLIYVFLFLFIILLALFPLIADYSNSRYRQTKGLVRATERSQEYLESQYPSYGITVRKLECEKKDDGKFYYKGYARDRDGIEYVFSMDMGYQIETLYICDENVKAKLEKIINDAIKQIGLTIDGYELEFTAFPAKEEEDNRFRLYIRMDMRGGKISARELVEDVLPIKDKIIKETREKYILNNLAVHYSCGNEGEDNDMLINLGGEMQRYNAKKIERMVKYQ